MWDATNIIGCKDQTFKSQGILQIITARSMVNYMDKINLLAREDDNSPRVYRITADHDHLDVFAVLEEENFYHDRKKDKRYPMGPRAEDVKKARAIFKADGISYAARRIFTHLNLIADKRLDTGEEVKIKRTSRRR